MEGRKEPPEKVKEAARMVGGEATPGLPYKGGYVYGVRPSGENGKLHLGLPHYVVEEPDGLVALIQPASAADLPLHGNI